MSATIHWFNVIEAKLKELHTDHEETISSLSQRKRDEDALVMTANLVSDLENQIQTLQDEQDRLHEESTKANSDQFTVLKKQLEQLTSKLQDTENQLEVQRQDHDDALLNFEQHQKWTVDELGRVRDDAKDATSQFERFASLQIELERAIADKGSNSTESDAELLRQLEEKHEKSLWSVRHDLEVQVASVRDQLAGESSEVVEELKDRLVEVEARTEILMNERRRKEEERLFLETISDEPNLIAFYRRVLTCIERIVFGAKAGASGMITLESGNLSQIAGVLEFASDTVDLVPVLGPIFTFILTKGPIAALQKLDGSRQANIATNISNVMTLSELKKHSQQIAKWLVLCYSPQILGLATPTEVAAGKGAIGKRAAVGWSKGKKWVLYQGTKSSAEVAAEFVVGLLADVLEGHFGHGGSLKSTGDDDLSSLFISTLTHKLDPHKFRAVGTFSHSLKKIKDKILGASVKFALSSVASQQDPSESVRQFSSVHLVDIFVRPAVRCPDGSVWGDESRKFTDRGTFGECFGSRSMALSRGLTQINDGQFLSQQVPFSIQSRVAFEAELRDNRQLQEVIQDIVDKRVRTRNISHHQEIPPSESDNITQLRRELELAKEEVKNAELKISKLEADVKQLQTRVNGT